MIVSISVFRKFVYCRLSKAKNGVFKWQPLEKLVILFEFHFQFAAKSSVTDPKDIRIIEPDTDGGPHEATHLRIGDDQTHYYDPDGAEDDDERGGWGNKLDFLFSCISVSVGLGSKSIK